MHTSLAHPADRHLVGGKSACFVRADDGGAAKGLYRWEGTDYSIFAGHAACSKRQARGDDGRKTFEQKQKLWEKREEERGEEWSTEGVKFTI